MRALTEQQEKTLRELYTEMEPVWKSVLAESMPWLVETTLEVGKWYKTERGTISHFNGTDRNYGIAMDGDWIENHVWLSENNLSEKVKFTRECSTSQVETALIKEAKKRGYELGNFECLIYPKVTSYNTEPYQYYTHTNTLYLGGNCLFHNGTWATIVITKEEAEKLLGKKII